MAKNCSQCGYELDYRFRTNAHSPQTYRVKQWFCNYCNYHSEEKVSPRG